MRRVLAFTLGVRHPSSRLRIEAYRTHLKDLGWDLRMHAFHSGMGGAPPAPRSSWQRGVRRIGRAWQTGRAMMRLHGLASDEPVLISRELPIRSAPFLQARNPLVLDIDDALYLGPGRSHIHELCQRAQLVVCGNATLAEALAPRSRRCVIIPTVVDTDRYRVRTDHGRNGPIRIGWLGSSMSVDFTLLPLMDTLRDIRRSIDFQLVTILDEPPAFLEGLPWVRHLRWSPEVETALADHVDVGIMPLQGDPFQAGKCGAKLLQYMAAGLPTIATPSGVNRDIVSPGVSGCWAATPQDWFESIRHLADNAGLRSAMGQAGRRRVEQDYSITRWAPEWRALLESL